MSTPNAQHKALPKLKNSQAKAPAHKPTAFASILGEAKQVSNNSKPSKSTKSAAFSQAALPSVVPSPQCTDSAPTHAMQSSDSTISHRMAYQLPAIVPSTFDSANVYVSPSPPYRTPFADSTQMEPYTPLCRPVFPPFDAHRRAGNSRPTPEYSSCVLDYSAPSNDIVHEHTRTSTPLHNTAHHLRPLSPHVHSDHWESPDRKPQQASAGRFTSDRVNNHHSDRLYRPDDRRHTPAAGERLSNPEHLRGITCDDRTCSGRIEKHGGSQSNNKSVDQVLAELQKGNSRLPNPHAAVTGTLRDIERKSRPQPRVADTYRPQPAPKNKARGFLPAPKGGPPPTPKYRVLNQLAKTEDYQTWTTKRLLQEMDARRLRHENEDPQYLKHILLLNDHVFKTQWNRYRVYTVKAMLEAAPGLKISLDVTKGWDYKPLLSELASSVARRAVEKYVEKHGDNIVDVTIKEQTQSKDRSKVEQRDKKKHNRDAKHSENNTGEKPATVAKPKPNKLKATEKVQNTAEKHQKTSRKLSQGTDSGYSTGQVNSPSTPITPDQDIGKGDIPAIDVNMMGTADQQDTMLQEGTVHQQDHPDMKAEPTSNLGLELPKGRKRAQPEDNNENMMPSKKMKISTEVEKVLRSKKTPRRRKSSTEPAPAHTPEPVQGSEGSQEPELSVAEYHSEGDIEMSDTQVYEAEQTLKKPKKDKPKVLSAVPRGIAVKKISEHKFVQPASAARKIGSKGRASNTASKRRSLFIK
jgi:hypothetical protein